MAAAAAMGAAMHRVRAVALVQQAEAGVEALLGTFGNGGNGGDGGGGGGGSGDVEQVGGNGGYGGGGDRIIPKRAMEDLVAAAAAHLERAREELAGLAQEAEELTEFWAAQVDLAAAAVV